MVTIYCTTCSKEKVDNPELIEAIERYKSDRINHVYELSKKDSVDFRILSGRFGLIEASEKIPWYDHMLKAEEVSRMINLVKEQILQGNIDKIIFFTKDKENYKPYNSLIEICCKELSIELEIKYFD